MKKRIRVLAALLCVTAMAVGCGQAGDSGTSAVKDKAESSQDAKEDGGKAQEQSEVTIGFSSEGDSFDPCTGFGYTGSPLYSNLVKVNGEDQLENDLATEYSVSDDALTWTFQIRDDVKFTNGDPLTASDVAFTFNTAKEKATYMDLTMMESCTAPDETTVKFQLTKPCVTFIYTVAQMGIVPEKATVISLVWRRIRSSAPALIRWCSGIKGSNLSWRPMRTITESSRRFSGQWF